MEVQIGGVTIYCPFGEFRRAQWCSRPRPITGVLLAPSHDEFRGPRSDYVKLVALATTTLTSQFRSSTCGNFHQLF
ncbi:hypothetical protein TNCV_1748461 [Trichonephila clavipes]|nr:hypothetical protein TNCV_1748461 [Trichonephila clavipes]